ncbi:MAG TPA: diguanylate cyclase [Ruminococcus sp.]|nr:diguanylate cyclase [Ruminococcus sp.]
MSGSIKKRIGFSSAIVLVIFVVIVFSVSCLLVRMTGLKYQRTIASEALDMAELTINADLAKEAFNTRTVSDEYSSVQNKLIAYQERNSSEIRRISLVSFSNTSGSYIYDTGGALLGSKLEYDGYTSSIKAELINGRKALNHSEKGISTYYRPVRTVDDSLCGYMIVELEKPYEYRFIPATLGVLAGLLILCGIFVTILITTLNRRIFRPIKQITSSAVYLSGDDNASEGKDASVFFDTNRSDEIGHLSKALQKILFEMNSSNENLSQALFDANHDGMTHMLNKRCYHSMEEMFRSGENICLIYFDVNNLKLMNDTLGHECGDYVITSAADYIRNFLGPNDHCFRMGGDEFLMVMTECTYRRIDSIVDKLENDSPIILSKPEEPIKCALSYGCAYAKGKYSYDELLAEAEENMYEKKTALKKLMNMPDR